jgi:YaiO family outer membrane protein
MKLSRIVYSAIVVGVLGICLPAWGEEDLLSHARRLAANNHRAEALHLLSARLADAPNDVDARLLYGLVLSWDSRWDEARTALEQVLAEAPQYADAVMALTNVELWSGHPEAADAVTSSFLEGSPKNVGVLLARARAMKTLKRREDESQALNAVLVQEPGNREAEDLRRELRMEESTWDSGMTFNMVSFSDHSSPWMEQSVSVRKGLNAGSLILRASRGYRFGLKSTLGEIDWYPHIRQGTYAYLNVGYSPEGILYPTYRAGAELFQYLGKGYEASAGLRRLQFTNTRINVYTGSIGRYHKDWYGSVRTFVTPEEPKTSVSLQVQLRRYFGDGDRYASLHFGRGAAPFEIRSTNDVGVLDSLSYGGDMQWRLGGHFLLGASGGIADQNRIERGRLREYFLSLNLNYRL